MFRSNASWNKTSEKFISPLHKANMSPGLPLVIKDIGKLSAFVIRWERRHAVSQKKWSSDAILTEDITIGMVHIDFPVVHVFGNKMCADVDRVGKYFLQMRQ